MAAPASSLLDPSTWLSDAVAYGVDAAQRTVLFWDVMRRRGAQYREHNAAGNPPVLGFQYEMVLDGRTLPRPTNYQLLRITPPDGVRVYEDRRPFVVIDPRAGQGAGIGGSQTSSQVGVALRAGHPVYFVSFGPVPERGQTIEDITAAEVAFLAEVRRRHPEAEGDPVLVGNCQAGWAVALLAGSHPEAVGPIVLAGTPLAYWDGPTGKSPMRYFGGLLGGTWLGELASDIGNGRFDGAYLVQNFERLNPTNTLFEKPYRVYERVDTEAERFLAFEKWWSGIFLMNAEEIRFISNELFVGNKLARGELTSPGGQRIDLRNIRSPIVVLASHGDNITPPAQALNWILDLYGSDQDIKDAEQTIVYCVHPDVGHLGIFVSGRLAEREHAEFIENIDLIELLPPGLYEAVITEIPAEERDGPYVEGRYATRFKARTLDDLRGIGGRSKANTDRFAAVARLSEVNRGLYQQLMQPWVRAFASEASAEAVRQSQPARLRYTAWTDSNPWFRLWSDWVEDTAEKVREERRPVEDDNPFWKMQKAWAEGVSSTMDAYKAQRDQALESWFEGFFGSPILQAMLGLRAESHPESAHPPREYVFARLAERRRRHHEAILTQGGFPEAVLRAGMYVLMANHSIEERAFNAFKTHFANEHRELSGARLRQSVREQHALLLECPEQAIAALPTLVPEQADRARLLDIVARVAHARPSSDARRAARLAEVEGILRD